MGQGNYACTCAELLPHCLLDTGGWPLVMGAIQRMLCIFWLNRKHSLIVQGSEAGWWCQTQISRKQGRLNSFFFFAVCVWLGRCPFTCRPIDLAEGEVNHILVVAIGRFHLYFMLRCQLKILEFPSLSVLVTLVTRKKWRG